MVECRCVMKLSCEIATCYAWIFIIMSGVDLESPL